MVALQGVYGSAAERYHKNTFFIFSRSSVSLHRTFIKDYGSKSKYNYR